MYPTDNKHPTHWGSDLLVSYAYDGDNNPVAILNERCSEDKISIDDYKNLISSIENSIKIIEADGFDYLRNTFCSTIENGIRNRDAVYELELNSAAKKHPYGFLINNEYKGLASYYVESGDISFRPIPDNIIKSNINLNMPGVYLINSFYIGQSKNIHRRVKAHLNNCFFQKHCNVRFQQMVMESIKVDKCIEITFLSPDVADESDFIYEYIKEGYPLTNKENKTTS